ncbi:putative non-specific serine/threonine protein kinase [Helianthus anomalus]
MCIDGNVTDTSSGKGFSSQRDKMAHCFTFHELAIATHNFMGANLIGKGGFGRVYKGQLESGESSCIIKLFTNYHYHFYHLKINIGSNYWHIQGAYLHTLEFIYAAYSSIRNV